MQLVIYQTLANQVGTGQVIHLIGVPSVRLHVVDGPDSGPELTFDLMGHISKEGDDLPLLVVGRTSGPEGGKESGMSVALFTCYVFGVPTLFTCVCLHI